MITPESLVNKVGELSSLPDIYHRIDKAINDPNSSFDFIAAIICEDAALSARLLKIANSALYSFPSKIETISRAMSVLGAKQLRDMVLATTVINMFDEVKNDFVSMRSFWQHSIACGVAARVLATFRRENNVERFYVAGLLHDIGKLIIYSKLPDKSNEIFDYVARNECLSFTAEKSILGFNHTHVAKVLLERWNLPKITIESIVYHHAPTTAPHYLLEASVIHIADILTNAMALGSSGETFVPQYDEKAWGMLELGEQFLPKIVERLEEQYLEAISVFSGGGDES